MYKLLLFLVTTLALNFSYSQSYENQKITNGVWVAAVGLQNSDTLNFILGVENNILEAMYVVTVDENGLPIKRDGNHVWTRNDLGVFEHTLDYTKTVKDATVYTWINEGGIWTETQIFIINVIDANTCTVTYIRCVKNKGSNPWYYVGQGVMSLQKIK